MAWDSKSRSNKNVVRLIKQVAQSEFEYIEYDVKKIRFKTHYDVTRDMFMFDLPRRSSYKIRSWKGHREKQYRVNTK
ncbi:hypothetical protein [Alishewanella phage vB_AspM_Slicko01]|nr:hypothetical protein [Alishewanella phage vB_AspM_Slicko01]